MEGQNIVSDKLRFLETRTKYKATEGCVDSKGLKLITGANNHGLIYIGFHDKTIKSVLTDHIIIQPKFIPLNQFIHTIQLTFVPTILSVAHHGYSSILLVSGFDDKSDCPAIELFDIEDRSSIGKVEMNQDFKDVRIVDYAWHPAYYESIVALCTDKGHLLIVGFSRTDKCASLVYNNQQYGALTCCWSPKGKNLAIGTSSGKIIRLEPIITESSFTFKEVENGIIEFEYENITPEHHVIKIRWIVKNTLFCVHAKQGGLNSIYSIATVNPGKPSKYWTDLCYEKENPNHNIQLVNLTSSVICSSSSSSEAAVLGIDSDEDTPLNEPANWNRLFIAEEGGSIQLPFDDHDRESYPRGATVVCSSNKSELVDRPIVVFYTSDSVLLPLVAVHSDNSLKQPELRKLEECPLIIPKPEVIEKKELAQDFKHSVDMKTIAEEQDDLDLPATPRKAFPRESIGQWSTERKRSNMSVKSLVTSLERRRV